MPNINYCSLEEVWGNSDFKNGANNDIKEDMDNYNNNNNKKHKTHLQSYDESNELFDSSDYNEIVNIYSKNDLANDSLNELSKNSANDNKVNNPLSTIIENFSSMTDDENNNDLILLVILGIFIIFVMDSLVKLKVSF
tara:strand:- start:11623 stop:12036 length:414 start_codon:yes stop_codon:yes gene_type:complete